MSDPRTALVGVGYDAMADTWEAWSARVTEDPRRAWREKLVALLPEGADVVELGCGNGTEETRELAARFNLTGVDLSSEQLRRARERVPRATFVQADLTSVSFDESSRIVRRCRRCNHRSEIASASTLAISRRHRRTRRRSSAASPRRRAKVSSIAEPYSSRSDRGQSRRIRR